MKTIVLVHGMGIHTEESLITEFTESLKEIFQTYETLSGTNFTDYFNLITVEYDSLMDDYRQAVQGRKDLLTALRDAQGDWPLLQTAASEISQIELSLIEDRFFNSHWLDVLLYRYTMIGELIRLKLSEIIAQVVADEGSANVHVMGHSLGTAVVHDTLAKLYGPEPDELKLSNSADKLGGVHMIANVSRLLQTFRKVGASEVRPVSGCCSLFYEYRHTLDPLTKIKPFDPTNNGGWISHAAWKRGYRLMTPSGVTSANVHALSHYLKNPDVHLPLFNQLFRFKPLSRERDKAKDAYDSQTLALKAVAVRETFEEFNFSIQSPQNFLKAGKALKDIVEQLGDEF